MYHFFSKLSVSEVFSVKRENLYLWIPIINAYLSIFTIVSNRADRLFVSSETTRIKNIAIDKILRIFFTEYMLALYPRVVSMLYLCSHTFFERLSL
jgi:hypothetical protein